MDELLFALVVGLFRLIIWLFKQTLSGVRWLFRQAARRLSGAPIDQRPPPARLGAAPAATSAPLRLADGAAARALSDRLRRVEQAARAEAARCEREPLNHSLAPTFREYLATSAGAATKWLRNVSDGNALQQIARDADSLEMLLEIMVRMAGQRRDNSLSPVLGDANALADACYAPIVDFCATRAIKLSSDRTATVLGDECSPLLGRIDDPTGLAILQLPWGWLSEIVRWPAIAHEVGHDFFASVEGFAVELKGRLRLPPVGPLPDGRSPITTRDLDHAVTAWADELFADAFGTLMLGPAYLFSMATIFAQPDRPVEILAVAASAGGGYEAHPPGHVRVLAGCRLLAMMGYGADSDAIARRWHHQHDAPDRVYLPTQLGRFVAIDDEPMVARAAKVGAAVYEEGMAVLAGMPLRSIAGLDYGPREHQAALAIKAALLTGRRPTIEDPRLLIAGAVLAWVEQPSANERFLAAARALVVGLGERRSPAGQGTAAIDGFDANMLGDAILLDALLRPPPGSRLRR